MPDRFFHKPNATLMLEALHTWFATPDGAPFAEIFAEAARAPVAAAVKASVAAIEAAVDGYATLGKTTWGIDLHVDDSKLFLYPFDCTGDTLPGSHAVVAPELVGLSTLDS